MYEALHIVPGIYQLFWGSICEEQGPWLTDVFKSREGAVSEERPKEEQRDGGRELGNGRGG